MLLALILVSLSIVLLWQSFRAPKNHHEQEEAFPRGKDLKRMVAVALTLIGFVVLLRPFGYWFCSTALMVAILRLLGLLSWRKTILISLLTTALSYYLFASVLGVPLPRGILLE